MSRHAAEALMFVALVVGIASCGVAEEWRKVEIAKIEAAKAEAVKEPRP